MDVLSFNIYNIHRNKYKVLQSCTEFCSTLLILLCMSSQTEQSRTTFGFCSDTNRLVDTHELLQAAKAHSLPGLGVCWSRDELLQALRESRSEPGAPPAEKGREEL